MPASHPPHNHNRRGRNGSLSIPAHNGQMPASRRFDGPRSPPNTSHVPCKFFRQGACQAGNACPFSHDIGAAAENICKYFAKGNCKFGPKCANIHVLPDGRRINYGKNGVTIGAAPTGLGNRVNPTTYHHSTNSALTTSFMHEGAPPYGSTSPFANPEMGHQPNVENGIPIIDTTYSSNPPSAYGSPRDGDLNRYGHGLSPVPKGLSVLDAPLPASFDSNGISHAARYGPWPSSVPSRFGFESSSLSTPVAKNGHPDTLKFPRHSALGSNENAPPANPHDWPSGSPPSHLHPDEFIGKRAMHSQSARHAKPRLLSSSVPKIDLEWEPDFMFEEEYVPESLANDILTPAEKARRGSATLSARVIEGHEGSPFTTSSATKFGSPVGNGSPSRFGPLFSRQLEDEFESGNPGRAMKHAASAFGHVGSPLRTSSLAREMDSTSNGLSQNGNLAGANVSDSMSVLTQQLQRAKLAEEKSGALSPHLHPSSARSASVSSPSIGAIGKEREREKGLERKVSSGSTVSSYIRHTAPIDEEDPAFVFSMEEEDDTQVRNRNASSSTSRGDTSFSAGWTYAGVARANASSTGINDNLRDGSAIKAAGGR